jgi:hypothetical protein
MNDWVGMSELLPRSGLAKDFYRTISLAVVHQDAGLPTAGDFDVGHDFGNLFDDNDRFRDFSDFI